ncbi:MAG: hypothetical protein DCC75_00090 [Proteobacteria bacterium]|nr:MAG: hypothetical protein DCC75_00090 [Pseudomonadota bacterium]
MRAMAALSTKLISSIIFILTLAACTSGGGGVDFEPGAVRVNVSLVGPVTDSEDSINGIDKAVSYWRQIYGHADINLDVEMYSFDGPRTLPNPKNGDALYQMISSATRPNAVNIVFGSQVSGLRDFNSGENFGIPGGSPGSLQPSPNSAVAISVLQITGADGLFDYGKDGATERFDAEKRVAAEEMARLTAVYLGVPLLVRFQGGQVAGSDTLGDTPSCITYISCRETENTRGNVMFPFPMPKESILDEFYPRDQLTFSQRDLILSGMRP